jgi:AraC-like DNA-binding protein
VILQLSYWITEVSLFSAFLKGKTNLRRNENSTWIIWIRLYLVCQTLIFIPCVLMFFPVSLSYVLSLFPVFIAAAGILTAFSLFVHPEILYGMKIPAMPGIEIHHKPPVNTRIEKESGTGQKTMGKDPADLTRQRPLKNLTQKQIGYIKHELESLFETKQPFLQHGYILQDLSNTLSIPLHQLSALINHEYKMNFNDLINKYRVEYAIELYNSGRHENLNINGLATESGFNNRNSFTMAFKKFTGFTPSDYFRNQKKD